jgi:hypothetical protein
MANSTTVYRLPGGRMAVDVTEDKTLATKDQGTVQNIVRDNLTITLPATAAGLNFTIRNGGAPVSGGPVGTGSNYSMIVTVSPNAVDLIEGQEMTAADDKDLINTKATARVGDEVTVIGNGTTGWNAHWIRGVWARQA